MGAGAGNPVVCDGGTLLPCVRVVETAHVVSVLLSLRAGGEETTAGWTHDGPQATSWDSEYWVDWVERMGVLE